MYLIINKKYYINLGLKHLTIIDVPNILLYILLQHNTLTYILMILKMIQ